MPQYISTECQKNIAEFQYRGGTASVTYGLIWSPLAEYCLKFFPKWMAPNLITLGAFSLLIVANVIFMFVGDNRQGLPAWKAIMMGASILIYQTLDNIDGKQARRTGTASPVGMLLDHGSDTMTTFLLGVQMIQVMEIHDVYIGLFSIYTFMMTPVFCAIWIQYSTGVFRLGRINLVDEGLPAYAIFCFISPFLGLTSLNTPHWFGTYRMEAIVIMEVMLLLQLYSINKNINKERNKKKRQVGYLTLVPITVGVSLLALYFLGPNAIYEKIYYYIAYTLCFLWGRTMILIQVSTVAKQKFNVFNIGVNFYLIAIVVFLVACRFTNFNVVRYFQAVLLIQFVLLLEFLHSTFNQLADILQIKLFRIPYKKD